MTGEQTRFGRAERDLVALGIAVSAIILFVGTGGSVLPEVIAAFTSGADGPNKLLVNALLLNIALIIFGWRRYRQLTHEIAERRNAEERARRLAEMDPLTGCLNRRSMAVATEALRERAREDGEAVAYAMIDLDNFKQINDFHGHSIGDSVLLELAQRISSQLPRDALLARLGGDEFSFVVTYDRKRREMIDKVVTRLFEVVGKPFQVGDKTVRPTMSIGIASNFDEAEQVTEAGDAEALMHRADIAMYHAKNNGKNRYFWFEPSMETEVRFRNELEAGIRAGIANGEFVPFYEQQVDVDTGRLVGFEMLARWRSGPLGLVGPEIFIPIAEEAGLIGELSDQLMAQAFSDAREWDDHLTLSINVSPCQLRDAWFSQKLLKLLEETGFPPHRLEIEISESCLHENFRLIAKIVTGLRALGIRISLDDFGTGYSSLEQLRALPFDRIKIDRVFIRELRHAPKASNVVEAMVSLGRGLDLPITAEGIEDQTILDTVRRIGQLKGQGYIYGKPEAAEQVTERLKAMRAAGSEMLASTVPVPQAEAGPQIARGSEATARRAAS